MKTSKEDLTLNELQVTTRVCEALELLKQQLWNYEHSNELAHRRYEVSRRVNLVYQQIEALEIELEALFTD